MYHQVCSSEFVSDVWIRHLATGNGSTFYGDDFRITGAHAFRALDMFCQLAHNTIANNLVRFYSSQYFSRFAISPYLFEAQIGSILEQFQSSMSDTFVLSLKMIRDTTQVNALFSALQTNYKLSGSKDTNNVFVMAKNYDGCSCSLSANCIRQSSIYDYNTMTILFNVTGFYTGCNVIESLLQSTLECFYNQTCINELQKYLLPSPMYSSAVNSLSSNQSLETATINTLVSNLMVERWQPDVSYEKYYAACSPEYCSYYYNTIADNSEINTYYIVVLMFFLVGGPLSVLKLLISALTKIIVFYVRKPPRQVVPQA
ncbi:unnamed protein product [Adineta steineri]|uniref:Uncharacterized protein n=1 Tax=Adineta steineri TaxID=433720 RepID=A0A814KHA1_9BILA|nr:unnamed protein product [Adineta steineri]CAF1141980.1 unnamed protein product [Adineta steineri]